MKFWIALHQVTPWNLENRIQGHSDGTGTWLTDLGKQHASDLGHSLRGKNIGLIICSDLKRAQQTATIINVALGVTVINNQLLRECSFGNLEGLTTEDININYPKDVQVRIATNRKRRNLWDFREFGGQSSEEVLLRHLDLLTELNAVQDDMPGTNILLVGHARSIETLLDALGDAETFPRTEYRVIEFPKPDPRMLD